MCVYEQMMGPTIYCCGLKVLCYTTVWLAEATCVSISYAILRTFPKRIGDENETSDVMCGRRSVRRIWRYCYCYLVMVQADEICTMWVGNGSMIMDLIDQILTLLHFASRPSAYTCQALSIIWVCSNEIMLCRETSGWMRLNHMARMSIVYDVHMLFK